jgi:hypothetical protein
VKGLWCVVHTCLDGVHRSVTVLLLPSAGGEMKVELVQQAASVLFDVPDDMHEEIITLITAVAQDKQAQVPELAAAFGEWCWLVYATRGEVIEVLDVGCAR